MPKLTDHLRLPTIQVDWRGVWESFKQAHGQPVPYKGRLLFPDGWTHAAADYRGPEFAPPNDKEQLRLMQLHYWLIRAKLVKLEHDHFYQLIDQVRQLKRSRSVPVEVYVTVIERDEMTNQLKPTRVPIDPDAWESGRLAMLKQDLTNCQEQIRKYQNANTPETVP